MGHFIVFFLLHELDILGKERGVPQILGLIHSHRVKMLVWL